MLTPLVLTLAATASVPWTLVLGETGVMAALVGAAVSSTHPAVAHVDAEALERALRSESPRLLLDVRGSDEIAVSAIEGALAAPDDEALGAVPIDRPIVVYCSVGWRSAEAVEVLAARGARDVRHLEGGVFAWADAGRPVVSAGARVREVHPFDPWWALLLDDALEAYAPSDR